MLGPAVCCWPRPRDWATLLPPPSGQLERDFQPGSRTRRPSDISRGYAMPMPLPIVPISGKINRVLIAGVLLCAAIWSLEATAFSQTRASSARSAAQGQAPHKSPPAASTKALTAMRRPVSPATTDNWTCANGIVDQNWSDPMNWDHGVPTAGSDVSIPNAGSTCAVNLNGSGNVNNLGILAVVEV